MSVFLLLPPYPAAQRFDTNHGTNTPEPAAMRYALREIRLNDLADAVAFANERGGEIEAEQVRHTLSVDIREDGKTVAVALCLETSPGPYTIHLAMSQEVDEDLGQIATDTILRKMQAAGVGVSRIQTQSDATTDRLWTQTNWLDRIPGDESPCDTEGETGTPPTENIDDASAQAA